MLAIASAFFVLLLRPVAGECVANVVALKEPLPLLTTNNGELISPVGSSGLFRFPFNTTTTAYCQGEHNVLVLSKNHSNLSHALLTCGANGKFFSHDWVQAGSFQLEAIGCSVRYSSHYEVESGRCGPGGAAISIDVGVEGWRGEKINLFTSCFKRATAEVLYVLHTLTPQNAVAQQKVKRINFRQGPWYPGLSLKRLYSSAYVKRAFESLVGPEKTKVYLNNETMLSRGHLSAKVDFVLSVGQYSTFTYINCVPQWQPFNKANWANLETRLRKWIKNGNYTANVYTGGWGLLSLKNDRGNMTDVYLEPESRKLPVPLWMYKVVHDTKSNRSTVFLGLNNPHVTIDEAKRMCFCQDQCANNKKFKWLKWNNRDAKLGYAICCGVQDFRKTVAHLPPFDDSGLLY